MSLPMSYASVADVYATIPMLSSSSNITSAVVAHHGGRVQSMIDAKLATLYSTPFTGSPPPIINTIANDLTCYFVLAGNTIMANTLKDSPWPAVYKMQMDLLDQLATGKTAIVTASGTVLDKSTAQAYVGSSVDVYVPTFSELDFEQSEVDPAKINALIHQ